MRLFPVVLLALAGGGLAVTVHWQRRASVAGHASPAVAAGAAAVAAPGALAGTGEQQPPDPRARAAAKDAGAGATANVDTGRSAAAMTPRDAVHITWPGRGRTASARATAVAPLEPAVAAELAFKALQYVGVDPEAEQIWRRAIDDPATPEGVRSDLIEDLNQEGYLDNSQPTKADLPLIRARLELIERLAPFATDPVNAAAFEEAYKDLLAMYLRLGGEPRGRR
jgi:hypothetical protein